ncbi:MAG: thiamine phosphate synthase [Ignavibacteriae bacterium]|nr:MAG: thiamine phosphate synthase [Ignavibacteriota bacterium]
MKKIGRLCVITDTNIQTKYSHIEIAEMAIKGGADIVQFRDKSMPASEMVNTAIEIKKICNETGALLIINDRVDIAMLSDADGVHLGKEDIPVNEARKLLGKYKIIGATANSPEDAKNAVKAGADYIGFGHIFQTYSKKKATPPVGISGLQEIVNNIKIPVLAIGGIDLSNLDEVINTGVHGIAVIGCVVKSSNPEKTVKELRSYLI